MNYPRVAVIVVVLASLFNSHDAMASEDADINEMMNLESAFVNVAKTGDSSVEATFRSVLLLNIQSSERSVSRRAAYMANLYFGDSQAMLADLIALLERVGFRALSPPARINVMHLITSTAASAWAPALADRAREEVTRITTDPPDNWRKQQQTYFAKLEDRIASLPSEEAAAWSFATIQERDAKTKSLTDVDVFVCVNAAEDKDFVAKARGTAVHLADLGFGRVQLRRWPSKGATEPTNPPVSELSGFSTVVVDKEHPESNEVTRVKEAVLGMDGLPPFQQRANEGQASPWYLSLFLCPSGTLRLIGLTAVDPQSNRPVDPQSNRPKNCDEIYLRIDGNRIWEEPREICRGQRMELDIRLEEESTIELWEDDFFEDDKLGTIATKSVTRGQPEVVKGRSRKGEWRYDFEFAWRARIY